MRRNKWRGTILFVVILTVMGLTVGLRLYGAGQPTASSHAVSLPPSASPSASATPSASAPAASAAPAATPSPSAAPVAAAKKVDGAVEQTPYGPIQVELTYTGTRITAVTELQAPNDRGRSVEINAQAGPILEQEVLSSQSAKIDTVSGATYTSDGYAQSVQSAIDKS
ncbi:FMN-binding protein [Diaminobutyricibacter tongyongensis]|uniref:FMN-binding protein n=1 Tax=Leifsonia tongyongensis TaxID=1268043 RepID=A0A6L9XUQ4_9MICO|nr:FMN-binding protein [Diaminobutyricibacter tongyongensis]NEN05113.1 FMN-binding protein [Diaminobutyricibacter tongyongensis]